MSHARMRHVIFVNTFRLAYKRVVSQGFYSKAPTFYYNYGAVMKCVMSHTRMSRVTFVNTYGPDFHSKAPTFYTTMT